MKRLNIISQQFICAHRTPHLQQPESPQIFFTNPVHLQQHQILAHAAASLDGVTSALTLAAAAQRERKKCPS